MNKCECCNQELPFDKFDGLPFIVQIKYFDIWDNKGIYEATKYLLEEYNKLRKSNEEERKKSKSNKHCKIE